jgi:hypothetical protein
MDDWQGTILLCEPVCDDLMQMDELQGWKPGNVVVLLVARQNKLK